MEGKDISNQIKRRTLRCVSSQQIANDAFAVSGEFGVNSFECITLEIFTFDPTGDKSEIRKQFNEKTDYWKKQEGKTYSQLAETIKAKGGNTIQLRQFRFNELQRLNDLIDKCRVGTITPEEIEEAQTLEQLRRDSFGIRGTLIVPTKI
jgi:hypothetical protein